MSIDLPIENLMNSVPGIPPMLFYMVAGVMILQALKQLWGYVAGFVIVCAIASHPAEVNEFIRVVVQTVTQLSHH